MRKTYISVKCGLSRDPKHRQAMGECVWLFLHMLDITDWDTGVVHDWKDEAAAEDMAMPVRTLREQRRKLDELGYITCKQKQYTQDIVIHNWTNPREYSGEVRNKKQGGSRMSPQQDDIQGDTQGSSQDGTPTYTSKNQHTNKRALSKKDYEQAGAMVKAMVENSKKVKYAHRDKFPEPYLPFADLYNELTGQEPIKRDIMDWMSTFDEWKQKALQPEHIRAAYEYATRDGGFPVGRPGSLTNTAVGMKTKLMNARPDPYIQKTHLL